MVIIALRQEQLAELEPIGFTPAYSVGGLAPFYSAANLYYNRKTQR